MDIGGTPTMVRRGSWTRYSNNDSRVLTFSGYRADDGNHVVGPVTIEDPCLPPPDLSPPPAPPQPSSYVGWLQKSTVEAVYDGEGLPDGETTVFLRSSWVRWRIGLIDEGSELKEEWTYFDIPASGYGARSVNYGGRLLAYDQAGRLNQTTCAGDTIDRTTFNAMGWPIMEELGTSAGLTMTRENEYDDNGNLLRMTLPVDGVSTHHDRITDYDYDWRNRQVESRTTVEKDGGGDWILITATDYDNRGLVASENSYHTEVAGENLTNRETMEHDALGRTYRSAVYAVRLPEDIGTPRAYNPQISNIYYEAGGKLARNAPAGSRLFTAMEYDALGRNTTKWQAYEPDGYIPGSDPADLANAVVMEQQEFAWDDVGNPLSTIYRQRFDGAIGEGSLQSPSTEPKARISYKATYADPIGRFVADADYGTNGGSAWSRSDAIPTRSDTVLISSVSYDGAGNLTAQTDPAGIINSKTFDNADRLVTTVENTEGAGADKRTTLYEYTPDGWMTKLKSENSDTGLQVTEWVRGVSIEGTGSEINSNRLVYQKVYPDSASESERITYVYDRQLQLISMTDQAGTSHAYDYDRLGRLVRDEVTNFGDDVDDAVGVLETSYNERGLLLRSTSLNTDGSAVVNQIQRGYNDFNQMITEWQEHDGAVNTSISLKLQYTYADGTNNTVRPTGVTYPDSTVITTAYNGTLADAISRPDQVKESSSILASYDYLSLGTLVNLNYDAAGNAHLTMENGSVGDAGDKYTGLDRFGRLIETIWKTSSAALVRSSYGHNRSSGIVWRRDDLAHAMSVITQDNHYWYDGLRQVTRHDRGDVAPPSGPPYTGIDPATRQQKEDFVLDKTGNWVNNVVQSPALNQTRTNNAANQIESFTGPTGVAQPSYDMAGNTTVMPQPDDWTSSYDCTWDAWNRLVKLKDDSSVVDTFGYDATTRRTRKTTATESRDYYYDSQWRAVEERVSDAVKAQYTWSSLDRRTMIRRKRSVSGTLDESRFVLKDYLDPVAIVDTGANIIERYSYDAFGPVGFMADDFTTLPSSNCDWNFLFHAEFLDEENGLYNYGYRYNSLNHLR